MCRIQLLLLAFAFTVYAPCVCLSQIDGWRIEQLGLPPAAGEVRVISGVYHAATNGRTSTLDTSSLRWVPAGVDLGSLRLWSMQASGIAITQRGNDVVRYDATTRSISTRDNIYYQFEHDDSVVCTFGTKFDAPSASFLSLATWRAWPSQDTLKIDTVVAENVYSDVVACGDSTAIVFALQSVLRYHYGKAPDVVELPDTAQSHRRSVYVDEGRTHIAVMGRNSLMFSADHGRSWQSMFVSDVASVRSFCATSDPDVIYVVLDSVLTRYHVSTGMRETVHSSSRWGSVIMVDHGLKGTIVRYPDTVMLIDDLTNEKQLIHDGLPQRSVVDLIAVPDGIAGAGATEIIHHPSQGGWTTPEIDRYWLNIDPYQRSMVFRGGRSLNDLWLTRGNWALQIAPSSWVNSMENLLLPEAGCWAHPSGNRFTVINNIEGYDGDRQVTWWSGSNPDRLLLAKNGLRFLVAFEDSVFVAFADQSSTWRTVDQSHLNWIEVPIPPINLGNQPQGQVKGRHGVVRGPRMKAWTHDAGRRWEVDSLSKNEQVTIANNGVIFHVWEDEQQGSEFSLVIDRQIGSERTVIAALPDSIYDSRQNDLTAVAYDDNEQRLYIATNHWVGSLSVNAVSVRDDVANPEWTIDNHRLGWYDLFGRYLGVELPNDAVSGLYIEVSERGIKKHLRSSQGLP